MKRASLTPTCCSAWAITVLLRSMSLIGPRTAKNSQPTWMSLSCHPRLPGSNPFNARKKRLQSYPLKPLFMVWANVCFSSLLRIHLFDRHHSQVFVSEDMAVEDESADVWSAEVHEQLDLRVRYHWVTVRVDTSRWLNTTANRRRTGAIRDLNHVQKLAVDARRLPATVDLEVVLRQHLEVNLVLVQFMVFPRVVLDDPLLHRPLRRDDRRRVVVVKGRVNRIRLDGTLRACRSHASGGVDEERASILNL